MTSEVHFERAKVVHVGDLVFNRFHPVIDRPGGASIRGWIGVLEQIAARHEPDTLFIFGHGRPEPPFGLTGGRAELLVQRDYLSVLLDFAQKGIAAGKSKDELAAAEALPGFPDHASPSAFLSLANCLKAAFDELTSS